MYLFYLIFSLVIIHGIMGGELLIARTPSSIKFQGNDPIDQNLIPEIFSAAVGFTSQQDSDWSGMTITSPFNFAEAVIILYVDGVTTLGTTKKLHKYPLNNNEDEFVTWSKIKSKITERFPMENNTIIKLELSHRESLEKIKTNSLNENVKEDADFLREINNLNNFMGNIKKSNGVPDFYWLSLKSLHPLVDIKGLSDASTVEAKDQLNEVLTKLGKVFGDTYNNKALVLALVSDAAHTRRTRSLSEEKVEGFMDFEELKNNIYDPDFPVIFNIILWFSVLLVFSLLAVSVFIASMDPGRDSIIYRMTSNRMKKDS